MGLLGSKTKTTQAPLTSPEQQKVSGDVGSAYQALIKQLSSRIPSLGEFGSAIEGVQSSAISNVGMGFDIAKDAFTSQASGTPAYTFDFDEFDQRVGSPLMQSFQDNIAPVLREQYAFSGGSPGGFYSTQAAKGVGTAANDFYTQNILPAILQGLQTEAMSVEGAAGRQLQAAQGLMNLPAAQVGAASNVESAAMQNIMQLLQSSGQFGTTPTMENIVEQGSSGIGNIAQMAMSGALLTSGAGGLSMLQGGLLGGGAGLGMSLLE